MTTRADVYTFIVEVERAERQVEYLRQPPAARRRRTGEMRVTVTERRAMQGDYLNDCGRGAYGRIARRFRRERSYVPGWIWDRRFSDVWSYMAKLSPDQELRVVLLHCKYRTSQTDIARELGVHQATVSRLVSRYGLSKADAQQGKQEVIALAERIAVEAVSAVLKRHAFVNDLEQLRTHHEETRWLKAGQRLRREIKNVVRGRWQLLREELKQGLTSPVSCHR